MKKHEKKANIMVVILLVGILVSEFCMDYLVIMPVTVSSDKTFGIIDGSLYSQHENIEVFSKKNMNAISKQHGDYVLEFLEVVAKNVSFYYFDAEVDGKITTEKIIEGLQWMLDLNVDCVTISLSSKCYSDELETWIATNSDNIKIYASYNNSLNSFDYPAQYEGVIGVGTLNVKNSKDTDVLYRTHNMMLGSKP